MDHSPPSIGYENQDGTIGEQIAYGWHEAPGGNSAYEITRVSASEYSWSSTSYDWIDIIASGATAIKIRSGTIVPIIGNPTTGSSSTTSLHVPVLQRWGVCSSYWYQWVPDIRAGGVRLGKLAAISHPQGYVGTGIHRSAHDSLIGVFWTDIDPGSGTVYYAGGAGGGGHTIRSRCILLWIRHPGQHISSRLAQQRGYLDALPEINTPTGSMLSFSIRCKSAVEAETRAALLVATLPLAIGSESMLGQAAPEHYYAFTAHTAGRYTFSSCSDSTHIRYLAAIYSRDFTREIAECDDCGDCPTYTQSILEVELTPGDYLLVVEGWSSSAGQYEVTMECELTRGVPRDTALVFSPITFESRPNINSYS